MPDPKDVTAYNEGVRLFKEGKILQALDRFRFAAENGEDRPMEHFALASAYLQVGDNDGAEKEYRRFLDMGGGGKQQSAAARKAIARFERERVTAEALQQAHRKARAEELQRQRLEGVQRLYNEAVNFFKVAGYDSCLKRLEALTESWGRTAEVLNLMGLCYKHLERPEDAVRVLSEALEKSPEHVDSALNLAQLYFESGIKRARQLIKNVVDRRPEVASAWFNLGVLALADGEVEEARRAWEKAAELDPNDERTRTSLKMVKQ
jgi:tetratricopeptide (TPR) repeat protein